MNVLASVVIGLALVTGSPRPSPETADLANEKARLEAELKIAKTAVSYMMIDLSGKSVSLKSRGIVLREWPIQAWKSRGRPVTLRTLRLVKKSSLTTPKRTNVTPNLKNQGKKEAESKPSPDLGVLELKDMPVHYTLIFGEGVKIYVRAKTGRLGPFALNIGRSILRFFSLPLKAILSAMTKKSFTDIDLVMPSEKDAQGLYWSFLDAHNTIIIR